MAGGCAAGRRRRVCLCTASAGRGKRPGFRPDSDGAPPRTPLYRLRCALRRRATASAPCCSLRKRGSSGSENPSDPSPQRPSLRNGWLLNALAKHPCGVLRRSRKPRQAWPALGHRSLHRRSHANRISSRVHGVLRDPQKTMEASERSGFRPRVGSNTWEPRPRPPIEGGRCRAGSARLEH